MTTDSDDAWAPASPPSSPPSSPSSRSHRQSLGNSFSNYISFQSILVRLFLVFESLIIFPTCGIITPQFIIYYSLYTLISTSVSFSLLIKSRKLRERDKVIMRYNTLLQKHLQNTSPGKIDANNSPRPSKSDEKRLSLPSLLTHVTSSSSLHLLQNLQKSADSARLDLQDLVITTGSFMLSPEGTPVNSPMGTPTRGKKENQKSFFERVVENPVFVVDELLSKKRTITALSLLLLSFSRYFLQALLGAESVKKWLILGSVVVPSSLEQYDLLFTDRRRSFSKVAMTSFTIHSVCLLLLLLSVSYEIPFVYSPLLSIFDFCYETVFPVGFLISCIEGWRVGCKGREREEGGREDTQPSTPKRGAGENSNITPTYDKNTPLNPNLSPERAGVENVYASEFDYWESRKNINSDTATCASSIIHRHNLHLLDQSSESSSQLSQIDSVDLQTDEANGLILEGVEQVSICASVSSSHKEGWEEEEEDEHLEEDSNEGGEGTGEGLKNLNLPIRPVEVHEFFQNQQT